MKLDKNKLLYTFILLQPIIDLVTGIMTKFEVGVISLGIILRGLFILIMLIYLLFFCNTKYKRLSIFYIFLLVIYVLFYFLTKPELLSNSQFFMNDLVYLFKYLYFLVLFITMFNFYVQYHLDQSQIIKIFLICLSIYGLLIFIPYLTNSSFSSYDVNKGDGVVGWFYAANDISNILILLFPFLIYALEQRISLIKLLLMTLTMFCCLLIGTKVAYFGIVLTLGLSLFYYLFYFRKKWRNLAVVAVGLIIFLVAGNNSYVMGNIANRVDKYNDYQNNGTTGEEVSETEEKEAGIVVGKGDTATSFIILSSRDKLLRRTNKIYMSRNNWEKSFGIGFSNRPSVNNKKIEKLVEMDFFDVLFHGGVILVILYALPFIFVIQSFVKYVWKEHFRIDLLGFILGYLVCLGLATSTISGHVFSSPAVLIYYVFIIILFLEKFKTSRDTQKRKISFLLLHLGNGGIERATVNTANSLVKYFDVELVVAYDLSNQLMYDIDDRIVIKYLIDSDIALRLNKYKEMLRKRDVKKFFASLKADYLVNHHFFKLISDFFDGFKVYILRKELMIKYLKKCNSDIIISTRVEYSLLLSKYGNVNSHKIAVEHRHHNRDKKYIKMIRDGYDDIDHLVVLTESLKRDFKTFLKADSKTIVVAIPNMLIDYPIRLSKLKGNRIISIGRVVAGKRVDEIIDIAKEMPDLCFEVIGDGDKLDDMKHLVSRDCVENVQLCGAMKNADALRHLQKACLFIMTSETEGLPMVLLEAFSYGVPVIAYQTDSGVSDIVDDGVNGYVVQNRNREEMISRIRELMSDEKKLKKFGRAARQKSLVFSEEEIVKQWLEIL